MSYLMPPPTPASKLGRYRTLSPLAGVRVSPIQLGGGNIGDKWSSLGFGSMDKEGSFKLLDAYFDLGVRQIWNLLSLPQPKPAQNRETSLTLRTISPPFECRVLLCS
jgi:hypothetical protein